MDLRPQSVKGIHGYSPITTISQQNAQTCSLDISIIISHCTSQHISVRKRLSSGNSPWWSLTDRNM